MYKLEYYVPPNKVDLVNAALFAAGAGRIGNYDSCCWVSAGVGQYRPLAGANPYQGEQGKLEKTPELKVEMVVEDGKVEDVRRALLAAHPYETPAYQLIKVE